MTRLEPWQFEPSPRDFLPLALLSIGRGFKHIVLGVDSSNKMGFRDAWHTSREGDLRTPGEDAVTQFDVPRAA